VGWLDFTHGITFANAVRVTASKYPHLWDQGLLQMMAFVGRNLAYCSEAKDQSNWFIKDKKTFIHSAKEKLLDHGISLPIFSSHIVKTALAVFEEVRFSSSETQDVLMASLNRFLHSPIKQKHLRRTAYQAIELVKKDYE
jgi:hypothetical protein